MFSTLFKKKQKKPALPPLSLSLDGHDVSIALRKNNRARRLILRQDKKNSQFVITLPPGCSTDHAMRFALEHQDWMAKQLHSSPARILITHGTHFPLRDVMHEIDHRSEARGVVWREDGPGIPRICVTGDSAHIERRIRDWLKREARLDLKQSADIYAQRLGVEYRRISLRDQTSRWGSCSSAGNLSFSWRLIFTPREVLDYVAAHEVAHLVEMNHSGKFWDIVEGLVPEYKTHTKWLKQNGPGLHQYF